MFKWENVDLQVIYEKLVNNYYGNMMVTDRFGNILYARKPPESKLNLVEEDLVGRSVFDLEREGVWVNAATCEAVRTGKRSIRLVKGRMNTTLLAVSTPIKNEYGNVELVITYSQDEEITLQTIRKFEAERNKSLQLANYLAEREGGMLEIVAENQMTKAIVQFLGKVAVADTTILLLGESGTGKEIFSRFIHKNSKRCDAPFIPVNCSAIPSELIESEFFGYTKGSFTGASKDGKAGFFELADKGTLFLDEIGELPFALQSKLLRVLETGEIQKIGSQKVFHTDARIIAATNKDLMKLVQEGKFRKDLYYRLSVIPVTIPPIRERKEDIEPLAKLFLQELNNKYRLKKTFLNSTLEFFKNYHWPGNVREIRNVVERLVITSTSDTLSMSQLEFPEMIISEENIPNSDFSDPNFCGGIQNLKKVMAEYEKRYVLHAIEECAGNVALAAEKLHMHRSGIYRKLEEYKKTPSI